MGMRMRIGKVLILLILVLILIFPQYCRASGNTLLYVGIYPVRKFLDAYPGSRLSFNLTVFNYSEKAKVLVQMQAADMKQNQDGSVEFLKPGNSKWSFAKNIRFSKPKFFLSPGEQRQVICTVSVPYGVKGGMNAAIFASAVPTKEVVFTPVVSYAAIILLKIPHTLDFDGRITNIDLSREGGQDKVKVIFQNTGNVYLWVKGTVTVTNSAGSVVERKVLSAGGAGVVLQEAKREFFTNIRKLIPGSYTIRAKLSFGQRRYIIAQKTFEVESNFKQGNLLTARPVQFYVAPTVLETQQSPGSYHILHYTIYNLENKPIHVKAFSEKIAEINESFSCAQWISFSPSEFNLPSGGKKIIEAVLKVPQEKLGGGKYARVVFEASKGSDVSRMESLASVLISRSKIDREGTITKVAIKTNSGKLLEFKVTLKNTGNVHLKLKGQVRVGDEEKVLSEDTFVESVLLLPGEEKDFSFSLPKLPKGKFLAEISFTYDEGGKEKRILVLKKFEIK